MGRGILFIIFVCMLSSLSGCPAGMKMRLENASGSDLVIKYRSGYEVLLESGVTRKINFNEYDCFRVKVDDIEYEYSFSGVPNEYRDVGAFSVIVDAKIDHNYNLFVHGGRGDKQVAFAVERGCNR